MLETKRKPYSILMSEAERHHIALKADALNLTVPEFIRLTALEKDIEKALLAIEKQQFTKKEAARFLAALGASRIPSNLNQIAKAINTGTLVISPDFEKQVIEGCAFIREMRNFLIKQQGLKP
jgi:NAD-dependent DNA ligase